MEPKHKIVKPKVALVEDDHLLVEFVKHYMEKEYEVETYGCAAAFFAEKDKEQFSAIVTDLHLGDFEGKELITLLRKNQKTMHKAIIVLSGDDNSESRISCLEAGADDYLTKPFNPEELVVRVKRMIQLREGASLMR